MGFNTTVLVLNDALCFIESDEHFGERLVRAIQSGQRNPTVAAHRSEGGRFVNAARVIGTAHADYYQFSVVGRNAGWNLTTDPDDGVPDAAIKQLEWLLKERRARKKAKAA